MTHVKIKKKTEIHA